MIAMLPAEHWAGTVTLQVGRRAYYHLYRHAPFPPVALLALALLTVNVASTWRRLHEDHGSAL